MTTIIKADSEAVFLGLVPSLLGYQPGRSVVVVMFEGTRSIGCARFVDDALTEPTALAEMLIQAITTNAPQTDNVVAIAYSDAPSAREDLAVLGALLEARQPVKGLFHVGDYRWEELTAGNHGLVSEIPAPTGLVPVAAAPEAGSELPELDEVRRYELRATWDDLVLTAPVCDGYIAALSSLVPFRDGFGDPVGYEMLFCGLAATAGDGSELKSMYELAKEIAAAFPESWVAHLGAAWAAWSNGRGTWAKTHLDVALPLTPDGRDATRLFHDLISHGELPKWTVSLQRGTR